MRAPAFPRVRALIARLARDGRPPGRRVAAAGPAVPPQEPPGGRAAARLSPGAEDVLRGILVAYRQAGEPLPAAFERHVRRRAPHLFDEIL